MHISYYFLHMKASHVCGTSRQNHVWATNNGRGKGENEKIQSMGEGRTEPQYLTEKSFRKISHFFIHGHIGNKMRCVQKSSHQSFEKWCFAGNLHSCSLLLTLLSALAHQPSFSMPLPFGTLSSLFFCLGCPTRLLFL